MQILLVLFTEVLRHLRLLPPPQCNGCEGNFSLWCTKQWESKWHLNNSATTHLKTVFGFLDICEIFLLELRFYQRTGFSWKLVTCDLSHFCAAKNRSFIHIHRISIVFCGGKYIYSSTVLLIPKYNALLRIKPVVPKPFCPLIELMINRNIIGRLIDNQKISLVAVLKIWLE